MGWLLFALLWASTQPDVPRAPPPPPPDPTAQMWVGIGMGIVVAIVLSPVTRPIAYQAGQRLGDRVWAWWTSRIWGVRAKGK